jgi:hypothetical protein
MTPRHLVTFIVGFLKSFLVSKWYGGTAFAVAAGVVVACAWRRRALLPLVLLAAYILLYASHIRSYYEIYELYGALGNRSRFGNRFDTDECGQEPSLAQKKMVVALVCRNCCYSYVGREFRYYCALEEPRSRGRDYQ